MDQQLQQFILGNLSNAKARFVSLGGGSINRAFRVESSNSKFFCKINSAKKFPGLFQKEQNGLSFLSNTKTIKVPEVIWCGEFEHQQILILEWIEEGLCTKEFWQKFGAQLAALHQSSDGGRPTTFGFSENNYMGALPQVNTPSENWVDFFINCRLQPQLELGLNGRLVTMKEVDQFNHLYKLLENIFPVEPPAALHGDLWNGNYLCDKNSEPVLIDPAVYFGHRSIDLGMTKLFGGFDEEFYDAYHYHFPLPENFEEQAEVCNLYPLLIHLNLFGSGYLSSIRGILKRYC
jgi:protein-ribulosamine 3-kinase